MARKVNLVDLNFSHVQYSSLYGTSNIIQWDRTCSQQGPTVYTDLFINDSIKTKPGDSKIAWLIEPRAIYPQIYEWIKDNHSLFKEVWTHDNKILELCRNAKFVPCGETFIDYPDHKIHEKSKLCSYIASDKNYTEGHQFRQSVRKHLLLNHESIDQFGRGYKTLQNKIDGLRDYAYSIAVENCCVDSYFGEKIIDCFVTGTIPIYRGTRKVSDFFDCNGIIFFDTIEELDQILHKLSFEDYHNRVNAIKTNFEKAKKFIIAEEWGIA